MAIGEVQVSITPLTAFEITATLDGEEVFYTRFSGAESDAERFAEKLRGDLTKLETV